MEVVSEATFARWQVIRAATVYFLITIDTEADNQWAKTANVTTENARFIPRFQALCDRYGFKPTYLCSYEMVTDRRFQETVGPFQKSGRAEIGAHLHPWSAPPFDRDPPDRHRCHPFPHELPLDLFTAKMQTLTEAIGKAFGRRPTSYRAGRYGFNSTQIDTLLDLGYVVDCSVVPFVSFAHVSGMPGGSGGMDFRRARPWPYYLSRHDCCEAGDSSLLEVPVTVLFPRWPLRSWQRAQAWLAEHERSLLSRAVRRSGYGSEWLRPRRSTTGADLIAVYQAAERVGLPCAEMMFHSSELMPGGSPTFPDEASIEAMYAAMDKTFQVIADRGGMAATLSEVAENFRADSRSRPPIAVRVL